MLGHGRVADAAQAGDARVVEVLRRPRERIEQVTVPVGLEPQSKVEGSGGHGLEVVGAVEPGGAVVIGRADLLQGREEVTRGILRSVEH